MKNFRLFASLSFAALVSVGCGASDATIEGGGAASFNAAGENVNENTDPDLGAAFIEPRDQLQMPTVKPMPLYA